MRHEGLKVDFRTKAIVELFLRYLIFFGCEHQMLLRFLIFIEENFKWNVLNIVMKYFKNILLI
jgi:hypothetical protein